MNKARVNLSNEASSNKHRRMKRPQKTNREVAEFSHCSLSTKFTNTEPQKQHVTAFSEESRLVIETKTVANQRKRPTATRGRVTITMCQPLALRGLRAALVFWGSRQAGNKVKVVEQNHRRLPPCRL